MKTKKPKGARATAQKRSHDRRMVLLDQQPIRQKAASECSRALARLEKAKTEWNRFQKNDQPAFQRWMTSLFDPLLIQVRGLEAAVSEKESLVDEVEMEIFFGGARSWRAAYREVRQRRDQPPPPEAAQDVPPPGQEKESDPYDFANLPEFEQEELFEHFVRVVMGKNPDKLNDRTYARMFADFKADVMGKDRPQQQPTPAPPPQPPPKPEQNRLKELYRLLVRRLHPDTQSENDTASTLWHEVQEAYGHGNVERLEMLLALTDVQANTTGEHTSVSQMRSVLAELRRALNQIQRNLRLAKDDPAWDFSRGADHSALEKRMARELKAQLQRLEIRHRQLEAEIAQWSTPPKSRKKPAKGR